MSRKEARGTLDTAGEAVTMSMDLPGNGAVGVQLAGTFVGTLTFELTINGVDFVAAAAVDVTTGGLASTATAPGIFRLETVGAPLVRVRASTWTSGEVDIRLVGLAG